jgi:hypothetical protein
MTTADARTRRLRALPRYDLVEYGGYYRDHQMDAAPDGEWVKYDDVENALATVESCDTPSAVHVGDETVNGVAVCACGREESGRGRDVADAGHAVRGDTAMTASGDVARTRRLRELGA